MDAIASILPSPEFYPAVLVWIACGLVSILILDWARDQPEPAMAVRRPARAIDGIAGHVIGASLAGAAVGYALNHAFP